MPDTTYGGAVWRLSGLAMILGPLLLLASTAAALAGDGLSDDRAAGILQVHAFAWLLIAVGALIPMTRVDGPGIVALSVVAAYGIVGGVAYGINTIYASLGAVDLNEDVEGAAPQLALQLPGIMFPLSFIALGVLLYRAGVRPRWAPLLLVAGGVLFPISRIASIDALAPVPDALFLLGLAPIGLALLRGGEVLPASERRSA